MFRQVFLRSTAQALFQTVSVLVMTVGGLAGMGDRTNCIHPGTAVTTVWIADRRSGR